MTKKELARALGISASMVTRLQKRGMPVDSVERAKRWRKKHLEPGRIKGVRFDPNAPLAPEPPAARPAAPPADPMAHVNRLAAVAHAALIDAAEFGEPAALIELLAPLRAALRQLPDDASPRMTARVWLALVDWVLSDDSTLRDADETSLNQPLTPAEFAVIAWPACPTTSRIWLELACDFRDFAIHGLPTDPDEIQTAEIERETAAIEAEISAEVERMHAAINPQILGD